ncbi:UMP-CMP kinase-like [Salmo trutta]|uniref:UMP-CMP kinase-like n=1 Tax=Salmo trutta TaxID=8032 RepID=UPI0011313CD6|nr:UMP-CMP kinase-like [Salmo trutta]
MEETRKLDEKKIHFLIDGFPRNEENLQGWTTIMDGEADVKFVLFFDFSNEVCINRCIERGKSSGLTDDNRASLEKRIHAPSSHCMRNRARCALWMPRAVWTR